MHSHHDKKVTAAQYYTLYHLDNASLNKTSQTALNNTTKKALTVMTIISKYPANSKQTDTLIQELKVMKPPKNMSIQLFGTPVGNKDVLATISTIYPMP